MKLLHIDSSILGEASASRELSASIVKALTGAMPGVEVIRRDLDADPIPHLDSRLLAAVRPDIAAASATRAADEKGAAALEEFLGADIVVIGAPMYNFAIPTQLKAWIDRIVQVGRTFRYTEAGPIGLAGGKQVVIVSSQGGVYTTPERQAMDFQESYLRLVLNFVGITDISIIRADGVAMGPGPRERAITAAHAQFADLFRRAA